MNDGSANPLTGYEQPFRLWFLASIGDSIVVQRMFSKKKLTFFEDFFYSTTCSGRDSKAR